MASVSGSKLAFFDGSGKAINLVLTSDGVTGTVVGSGATGAVGSLTSTSATNIEIFTTASGTAASGYQGSAFIQGAVQVASGDTNEVQAGSLSSTEQILTGTAFTVIDRTGGENLQIIDPSATITVVGSKGDTITGSPTASDSQLIDVSGSNPDAVKGAASVVGGAGTTSVSAGSSDTITGGAGALIVAGNAFSPSVAGAGNSNKITGGAGNLTVFNIGTGNTIVGSSSGWSFIDDNYGGSANTITGGAGNTNVTTPLGTTVAAGTFIIGGKSDAITGGAGTMLVNALSGSENVTGGTGATTVWGASGDSIAGGSGALQAGGNSLTITGGTGTLLAIGGTSDSIKGGVGAATVAAGTSDTVTGGTGTLQYNAGTSSTLTGGAGSVNAFNFGTGNSIVGSTAATTFIDDSYTSPTAPGVFTGGSNTLVGGSAGSTIIGGPSDSIVAGTGALEVQLRSTLTASDTVNLTATGRGAAGVRDLPTVTVGSTFTSTVTGFATATDKVESSQSVTAGGVFTGTSTSSGGNTTLTFVDGSKMTLIGVAAVGSITFTQ